MKDPLTADGARMLESQKLLLMRGDRDRAIILAGEHQAQGLLEPGNPGVPRGLPLAIVVGLILWLLVILLILGVTPVAGVMR